VTRSAGGGSSNEQGLEVVERSEDAGGADGAEGRVKTDASSHVITTETLINQAADLE
jgi:hypothetical protein